MEEIASAIEEWMKGHDILTDSRIYFNGLAWSYNSRGEKTIIEDCDPQNYFEYVNEGTLSMSFEGGLCDILNMYSAAAEMYREEFTALLEEYGYYYQLGNHWNLSLYSLPELFS